MTSNRNAAAILIWNAEGRKRKGKPRQQCMDGVRKASLAEISQKNTQRIVTE